MNNSRKSIFSVSVNSEMPGFRVRTSKFRHLYGSVTKKEDCYDGIRITRNAHDSHFVSVNEKFIAIVAECAGGGAFDVIPLKKTGRQELTAPRVSGHRGPVLDLKWNPFNNNCIASCSEDCTVKLWHIPDEGIVEENLIEPILKLEGHYRRVGYIQWHPTVENIIASAGYDYKLIIWNTETGEAISTVDAHKDTIYSLAFNYDGSLLATTCKDKKIRIIDPRTGSVVKESPPAVGAKSSKIVFLGNSTRLLVTGCSKSFSRQFTIWNQENLKEAMCAEDIDSGSGILFPFYDPDTKVLFLAGKGDGNIRFYEIVDEKPYYYYLNEYKSSSPQRGLATMPKNALQVNKCEIMKFYKIHAQGDRCEPISMIVPRKAETFQEDLYPDTAGFQPSLTVSEWISGINKPPILISLKDNYFSPNHSLAKSGQQPRIPPTQPQLVKKSVGAPNANSVNTSSSPIPPSVVSQKSENVSQPPKLPAHSTKANENVSRPPKSPAHSTKANETATTITKSSTTPVARIIAKEKVITKEESERNPAEENTANDKIKAIDNQQLFPHLRRVSSPRKKKIDPSVVEAEKVVTKEEESDRKTSEVNTATDKIINNQQLFPHLRRVSSLRMKKIDPSVVEAEIMNMDQLRKAYLRQQDEIRGLKNQIAIKNMRIKQLEKELEATKEAEASTNGTSIHQSEESIA